MNVLEKHINRKTIILMSFLFPLGVLVGCMIAFEVGFFGDYSFVIIDGLHQYMPFFSVLYDKLKSGGSLFYTFRAGLGLNFLALISYYLSSPLNLLILLFKKSQLNTAVSLLIVLKLSLSGLFAGIYFNSRTRRPNLIVLAAAMAYALNSFMIGYCWNVMWLDAIMVLPLIIMGIERLIQGKGGWLYGISLAYALYGNYYIGYMICIFSVLWFLFYTFKDGRQFFVRGLTFAGYSLLAGGMAAFMLLPAYMGIKQTAAGDEMVLPGHSFTVGIAEIINRQFDLAAPISNDNFDGNINLYMGIFVLFAAVLYFLNKEIHAGEKIKKLLLIAFFYLSFCENILNFIWHGFHDQYGIPNRFSFLMGFLLIAMMVDTFDHYEGMRGWHVGIACALVAGLMYYGYRFGDNAMEDKIYGVAGMLLLAYALFLFLALISRKHGYIFRYGFILMAVVEMCTTTALGYQEVGQISVSKFFSGTDDMEQAVSALDDGTFYRSELASAKMVDEATWYRLNNVGLFGSTASASTVEIMDSLGFYTGCNEYLYKGATPVTNLMFGLRYLYYHPEDDLVSDFTYRDQFGDFSAYENPAAKALSIGYMVSTDVDSWYYDSDYPFYVLNDYADMALGIQDIFREIRIEDPVTNGCSADRTNDGEYYFTFEEAQADNLTFTIEAKRNMPYFYLHFDGTQVENTEIAVDGETRITGDIDGHIVPLGAVDKGSVITVRMELKGEDENGYVRLSAADLDREAFREMVNKVAAQTFIINRFTDNSFEGMVTAGQDQELMFSIPYDTGWQITVDGEQTKADRIGNAFLSLYLEEGNHYITLKYEPPGFSLGWKISLISCLLFMAAIGGGFFIRLKKRRALQKLLDELESPEHFARAQDPETEESAQAQAPETEDPAGKNE